MVLALAGCRGPATEQPMTGDLVLCCRAANDDNVSFVGCRATSLCRANEPVWVRGPLTCTAAEDESCAGGRCCSLDVDPSPPIATLDADTLDADAPEAAPEPAPLPVPIAPVPLDWSPKPSLISVPNIICPATVERGLTGTVVLLVSVDVTGLVTEVELIEGFEPSCDELAHDALVHAEWEPARSLSGKPIASSIRYEYVF